MLRKIEYEVEHLATCNTGKHLDPIWNTQAPLVGQLDVAVSLRFDMLTMLTGGE
jgi:hypothetical protein